MKKYILAGGECAGKSTTLKALEEKGYHVLPESNAEIIANERLSKGNTFPWTDFEAHNQKVIRLQIEKENRLPKNAKMAFLDRALTDTLGYYSVFGKEPPRELLSLIQKADYSQVFYLEMIPEELVKDYRIKNRRNTYEISKEAHRIIRDKYLNEFNIPFIDVPFTSVDERVKFILAHRLK